MNHQRANMIARMRRRLKERLRKWLAEDRATANRGWHHSLERRMLQLQAEEASASSVLNRRMIDLPAGAIVVDVGANTGTFARSVRSLWPEAEVHALEADPSTFQQLRKAVGQDPRIHAHEVAVHSHTARLEFRSHPNPLLSSLLDLEPAEAGIRPILLQALTLDDWCASAGIAGISMLKVDTEGNDLNVLAGAARALAHGTLRWAIVEFGIDPADRRHVPLNDFVTLFRGIGFHLKSTGDRGVHGNFIYGNALFERTPV
ncbi:MAG TPA: FkbM family methyltransferase [Luteolibacter sp.]|nr:FkbM family methyltransferase [Luteolibacter sp.]